MEQIKETPIRYPDKANLERRISILEQDIARIIRILDAIEKQLDVK